MKFWPFGSRPRDEGPPVEALPAFKLARTLFAAVGDALLVVDPATQRLLDANPMAEKLSRQSPDQLSILGLREVIRHELGADDWLTSLQQPTPCSHRDGFLFRTWG